MFSISIYIKKDRMLPVFVKANSYMINKYKKQIIESTCPYDTLRKLWKDEWKIIISDSWEELFFVSEKSKKLFLLRWS